MANISKEVNIEMLEKLPDGTYKKKNPATKAELVKETTQKKFVSDAEKAEIAKVKDKSDKTYVDGELNKKETPAGAQAKATKALTDANTYTNNKVKTDVPVGAKFTDTVYNHPSTHPASMITESATKRFVSDSEKSNWNSKETPGGAQTKATKALTDANAHTNNRVKTPVPTGALFTDTKIEQGLTPPAGSTTGDLWLDTSENKYQGSVLEGFDKHLLNNNSIKHKANQISLADNKFTANNIEDGMSELFTNVSNGKDLVSGAITGVDDSVSIPTEPSFDDLANGIGEIVTGRRWEAGSSTAQFGVTVDGLPFRPSIILMNDSHSSSQNGNGDGWTIYVSSALSVADGTVAQFETGGGSTDFRQFTIKNDGFSVEPYRHSWSYSRVYWIAIE